MIFRKDSFFRDPQNKTLIIATLALLLMGGTFYHWMEGWGWIDSFYFSVMTLTTVGYGDFTPQTDAGKLFTIFYVIIGIGILLSFMNTLFQHRANRLENRRKKNKAKAEV